jgi:ABC-type uncharacterized transport system ATPase subunit
MKGLLGAHQQAEAVASGNDRRRARAHRAARQGLARDAGLAVLLISADLEELIGLSDRIVVMYDGRINARLTPAEATPELLGTYMTGGVQEVAS